MLAGMELSIRLEKPKRKRGRPSTPLFIRVGNLTGLDPSFIEAGVRSIRSDLSEDHWEWKGAFAQKSVTGGTSAVIRVKSLCKPVVRAMIEAAIGEPIPETWRFRRRCRNPKCVNPAHYKMVPYLARVGTPDVLSPKLAAVGAALDAGATGSENVISEIADHIYADLRDLPTALDRWGDTYTPEEITAAYELVAREEGRSP